MKHWKISDAWVNVIFIQCVLFAINFIMRFIIDSDFDFQQIREKMPKSSEKIVLFIEPNDEVWDTPSKIGHLFMNRFAVDEDPGFEIVKVLELEKTSLAMSNPENPEYKKFENERKQKGIDLMDAKELFRLF